jgi:predicted MFS family arabinose efflux permease
VLTPLIIGGRQPMSAALALSIGFVGAYGFVAAIALGGRPEFLFLVVAMCVVEIMMAAFNATLYASAFKWASAEQTATDISLQDSSFFLGMTIGGAASGGLAAWLGWLGFYFAVGAFAVVAIWSYAYWAIRIDGRLQSETAN